MIKKILNRILLSIKVLFGGGDHMPMLYSSLIIKGRFAYKDVPHTCTEQVKEILLAADMEHLITE